MTDIYAKERAIVTLANANGPALNNGSANSAATTFDVRAAGNFAEDFAAIFQLTAQVADNTGIAAGTLMAELYLVPAMDGANYPDLDLTANASYIPATYRAGSFIASKQMANNTNVIFASNVVDIMPLLYTAYIKNTSGKAISANWTLKAISARVQSA